MRSMTAFAEVVRPLEAGQLRLTLRSVNHKGLDLSVRLHPALLPLEASLRATVREFASRGRLDLAVEVQDVPSLEPRLNRNLLRSAAKAWAEDAEWLGLPPLTAEAFFRMPGAWLPPEEDLAERLGLELGQALEELLGLWNRRRAEEAERLLPFFRQTLEGLKAVQQRLAEEAEAQVVELPGQYRARLDQLLKDAQLAGRLPEERVVAEAGVLAERQDVREELVRLASHLEDLDARLAQGRLEGKALDIWCQEVLRELNTTGSKCRRLSMTRAVMEGKGLLEQLREQGANLE